MTPSRIVELDRKRLLQRTALMFGAGLVLAISLISDLDHATSAPSPARQTISLQVQPKQKPVLLTELRSLQDQVSSELKDLDRNIQKRIQEAAQLHVDPQALQASGIRIANLSENLDNLKKRRAELAARREALSQLILIIDTHWTDQPLREFMEKQLLELAMTDISTPQGDSQLWKFFTYLSIAIREIPEPREDIIRFIDGYIQYSSVLNPKTPTEFMAERHYTDGTTVFAAKPEKPENLGEVLENKQDELKKVMSRSAPQNEKAEHSSPLPAPEPADAKIHYRPMKELKD